MGNYWWYSSLQYVAFVPSVMVPFLGAMGRDAESKKEAVFGGAVGVILVTLALVLENSAILANYSAVCFSNVPTVIFAGMLHPAMGTFFAVIVFLGLFTTAAPMLWTICAALPTNKNKTSDRIVAAIICVLILFDRRPAV